MVVKNWPCRVLVVDDSALMRRSVRQILEKNRRIEVVGTARDGEDALVKARELKPQLITLDINMPKMDGLTCLAHLQEESPDITVVMVSSLTDAGASATLEAIELGAVGYVAKPGTMSMRLEQVEEEIIETVLGAHKMSLQPQRRLRTTASKVTTDVSTATSSSRFDKLLLIGISTGGPSTIMDVLPYLPADYPYPVILLQHMPATFTAGFAERLDRYCPLTVRESKNNIEIQTGTVTVIHGGINAEIRQERVGHFQIRHRKADPKYFYYIPNIDFTIGTTIKCLGAKRIIVVIMTGIGDDGARAANHVHRQGGIAIAEEKSTCVVFGMPKVLADLGCDYVEPSHAIASRLEKLL
ncbi:MAG TPA: chemotaxis-specific protein-glutamate methyltransferase CheB [Gammaproteobacteria bacterium]|nr:chemotaxis-specific protein-glutamate methyltransferase CheB [Gammaproteobacteria bacterium]